MVLCGFTRGFRKLRRNSRHPGAAPASAHHGNLSHRFPQAPANVGYRIVLAVLNRRGAAPNGTASQGTITLGRQCRSPLFFLGSSLLGGRYGRLLLVATG